VRNLTERKRNPESLRNFDLAQGHSGAARRSLGIGFGISDLNAQPKEKRGLRGTKMRKEQSEKQQWEKRRKNENPLFEK